MNDVNYLGKISRNPLVLRDVPDEVKTLEMCEHAVFGEPIMLGEVPDELKTQEMCEMQ